MVDIMASLLDADLTNIEKEVKRLENIGIDGFHMDVMDGQYVENFAFGPHAIKALREITKLPIEAHLEIINAERFIDLFVNSGSDIIIIHPECCAKLKSSLEKIKNLGLKAALAISPEIYLDKLDKYLDLIDFILIMTVNPGFGGQLLIENTLNKIIEVNKRIKISNCDIKIMADGGINSNTATKVIESGADILVIGSALFQNQNIENFIVDLKKYNKKD